MKTKQGETKMFYKLIDITEFDYDEQAMSSTRFIAAVCATSVRDAIFWFEVLEKSGTITIPAHIKNAWNMYIAECTVEEYKAFINEYN